jgi:hypothetical protein
MVPLSHETLTFMSEKPRLCACGCGEDISHKPKKDFRKDQYFSLYHAIKHQRDKRWKRYQQQGLIRRKEPHDRG